jgi:hypothetical protein
MISVMLVNYKNPMEGLKMIQEKEIIVTENKNWFDEYDKPREATDYVQLPTFEMKLQPGKLTRTESIIFVSDGHAATTRFGETIVFTIKNKEVDKTWFIKKTQYNLLNPIAKESKKGSLAGRKATVERIGSGANETRWSITFD